MVAPEDILVVDVSPSPSTPDGDVEYSDACYLQVLQGSAHPHELVCRTIDNDDAHTAFDISIRHLPTIHQPQDIPYVHVPWRPKQKE